MDLISLERELQNIQNKIDELENEKIKIKDQIKKIKFEDIAKINKKHEEEDILIQERYNEITHRFPSWKMCKINYDIIHNFKESALILLPLGRCLPFFELGSHSLSVQMSDGFYELNYAHSELYINFPINDWLTKKNKNPTIEPFMAEFLYLSYYICDFAQFAFKQNRGLMAVLRELENSED